MQPARLAILFLCLLAGPAFAEPLVPAAAPKTPEPSVPLPADALEDDEKGTLSLTLENDVFFGADRNYTNGFRASWVTPADKIPFILRPISRAIPTFPQQGEKRVSYAFGQSMFTPSDITDYNLRPLDRPYAGWLYGTIGMVNDTGKQLDTLELTLGIVGPESLAHPTQHFVHQYITDSPEPRGWYHQLDTEPGLILSYERKWRSYYQFSLLGHGVDFMPNLGASLGNVLTSAQAGATVRIGQHLPADYGPPRVRPSLSGSDYFMPTDGFGWYLFAGVQGRYVAHNIFLDGNTFTDSHSVEKENWVGDWQAGLAITYHTTRVTISQVHRTREYETQPQSDAFGSITVSTQF